ncbi:MAG: periplasmic heavy metal sensor [Nitrospira sp.]|nr:periplasmic heavy metal sensor [Nitrospira sp.]
MNMKMKSTIGLLAMTVLLGLLGVSLSPAWADEGHGKGYGKGHEGSGEHGCCGGHEGHGMGRHHASTGHLLRGLLQSQKEMGLTDEQVAKLKAIQLDLDKTRIKAEADIMVAERELHALIENDKSDLSAIEEKLKQAEMQEVALRLTAIKAKRDVMALLTPEQSQRVKAVHEAMMQRYKDGPQEGHKDGMMKGHGAKGEHKKDSGAMEPKH